MIRHYDATAGFPTETFWIKAIQAGFYAMWPMLTATVIIKYYPESDETQKGHMHQNKEGLQSTKTNEMGHPQPPMPIQTNNLSIFGIVTNKKITKATKAMDMH